LNQKNIFLVLLILTFFVVGTLKNPIFSAFSLGYIATLSLLYFCGAKIQNIAMNLGYVWATKWLCFVIFLVIVGMSVPNIFLESMFMFVLFNLTINPAFFINKETV